MKKLAFARILLGLLKPEAIAGLVPTSIKRLLGCSFTSNLRNGGTIEEHEEIREHLTSNIR